MQKHRGTRPVTGVIQKRPHHGTVESIELGDRRRERRVIVIVRLISQSRNTALASHRVNILALGLNLRLLFRGQCREGKKYRLDISLLQLVKGDLLQDPMFFSEVTTKQRIRRVSEKL